jgi:cytochrome c peroxidase
MRRHIALAAWSLLGIVACDPDLGPQEPPPAPPIDVALRQDLARWGVIPIGPMARQDPALVELGQALIFDKILSGNRDISCATCHHPTSSAADGLPLAIGTGGNGLGASRTLGPGRQFVPRSAPTLLNSGLGFFYVFWDGRINGFPGWQFETPAGAALPAGLPNILAVQAMFPVTNRQEMRGEPGENELADFGDDQYAEIWRALMRRLVPIPEYVRLFNAAFPGTPTSQLGFEHAATAMAAFQMQVLTKSNSPFDRYLHRDDAALTTQAKRGALLFFGRAQCGSCHGGPLLGGGTFANVGAPQIGPGSGSAAPLDRGLGEVNGESFYDFAFRVPPLRNVELTAPYTHAGAYATLEAVVRHYNNVDSAARNYDVSQLAPAVRDTYHGDASTISSVLATLDGRLRLPLRLTESEQADVVAFLKALTDPSARDLSSMAPLAVPSGLPVN